MAGPHKHSGIESVWHRALQVTGARSTCLTVLRHWFDSQTLPAYIKMSSGKTLNPKLLPMVRPSPWIAAICLRVWEREKEGNGEDLLMKKKSIKSVLLTWLHVLMSPGILFSGCLFIPFSWTRYLNFYKSDTVIHLASRMNCLDFVG